MSKEIMDLVQVLNDQVVTTSLKIAEYFPEKRHRDIVVSIDKAVAQFERLNEGVRKNPLIPPFIKSSYEYNGRSLPMYYLNRDGFSFIVMGFTGDKAAEFKWKFIEAFNAMESKLKYGTDKVPQTFLEALKLAVQKEEERLALEEAYQKEKERADENQEVKELYDTSVAQNNYWIPMKAVADILDCVGVGRTNLYRFLRDEGVLTSKNEPMRQYQENGFMKTSYYSDWLGQYVCVVSFKGLKFIFKKLKNANKIPRSTTFEDWVALCKDMVVQDDKSDSILTD